MKVNKFIRKETEIEILGVTLLSEEEIKEIPREILACGETWWLRTDGRFSNCVLDVFCDGILNESGRAVRRENGIRPAFILGTHNLEVGELLEIFGIKVTVINKKYALADKIMTKRPFDTNCNNEYESSEIKQYLNNWFNSEKEGIR